MPLVLGPQGRGAAERGQLAPSWVRSNLRLAAASLGRNPRGWVGGVQRPLEAERGPGSENRPEGAVAWDTGSHQPATNAASPVQRQPTRVLGVRVLRWLPVRSQVTGTGYNSSEGSEEERKMWESLEPHRHLLNGFDQNSESDMNNEVQAGVVSDRNEDLVFKKEVEHTSLENLHPDHVAEKKNPFSGDKFKLATKICRNNEESNVSSQDNEKNVSRACPRPLWQPLPSQAGRFRRKKWFHGLRALLPWAALAYDALIPAASAPVVAKGVKAQLGPLLQRAGAPSLVFHGVGPEVAEKSRAEVWEPPSRFQRMPGNAWMSRQKPSWRTSTRAVQKGNVGLEPPCRVPAGALPSGAVRRGPPSSRPRDGRSTDSLCRAPGEATDTQRQPVEELPKAVGTQGALDVSHGVKGHCFRALRFNDCPVGFRICTDPVAPLF
uniref:Uncharacterized protein n=1 Tax=Callithrix jacchus TaxID=9483 RepID=A0A5F4W816_CALJA